MRESRSDWGTTSTSATGALLADHDPPSDPAAARILVIEDDPDIGDLLREFLHQEGYEVTMVTTADQAVASVRAMPSDLITLDLLLPDADGWSVLERLRLAGASIPPVVVVSILPESRYGRPLGVVDYLSKPVRGPILRERVARALAQSRSGERTP